MHRGIAVCISVCILGTILYGSLTPGTTEVTFPHHDKLLHFLVYAVLAGWHALLLPQRYRQIFFLCFLWGLSIEGLQALTSYREASLSDLMANTLGIMAGVSAVKSAGLQWLSIRLSRTG